MNIPKRRLPMIEDETLSDACEQACNDLQAFITKAKGE